ncbi:chromate efflux transporter [Photobacterium galatheae]|uniref:chromate efflux transporter n=1 Tax=Photobacterium galatheae TaxID=1654360 RepID=UPI00202CF974|nr:chromate efflux transporter [Photobacterium galatheae]MCM0148976.1 chromate efflux transporter [Photobacterium galatheae]
MKKCYSSLEPVLQVFWVFFILGLGSFGGPAAHMGYFQRTFVQQKQWLNDTDFTQATALCQFLPGPASSQLGMFIGFQKAGYWGAVAAFIGFTLPSAILLTVLAILDRQNTQATWVYEVIQAAKLLAVIVVADALFGMVRKNLTDRLTIVIAVLTAVSVFFSSGLSGQLMPILIAAALGYVLSFRNAVQQTAHGSESDRMKLNWFPMVIFVLMLLGLPLLSGTAKSWDILNSFYQAGSFVFGGGHVVLPLLEPLVQRWVDADTFISAYASAQLVPGPMFTMASFLGAASMPESPIWGSGLATIAIFLPGSLLLFAFLPAWQRLLQHPRLQLSVKTITAAVVGLLMGAWVDPVIMTSIGSVWDIVAVCSGIYLLKYRNMPVWCLALLLVGYVFAKAIF